MCIKELYALRYPENAAFSYTNKTRKDVASDILVLASLFDDHIINKTSDLFLFPYKLLRGSGTFGITVIWHNGHLGQSKCTLLSKKFFVMPSVHYAKCIYAKWPHTKRPYATWRYAKCNRTLLRCLLLSKAVFLYESVLSCSLFCVWVLFHVDATYVSRIFNLMRKLSKPGVTLTVLALVEPNANFGYTVDGNVIYSVAKKGNIFIQVHQIEPS